MSIKTIEIEQALRKVMDIRKNFKTGEKFIKATADPLQTFFNTAKVDGALARSADKDIQKILKISLEAQEFIKSFEAKGHHKWKDATWLIENLTEGSTGQQQKNQQGILILQDLKTKLNAVKGMTQVSDSLAGALMVYLNIDVKAIIGKLTSISATNLMVYNLIKKKNQATRNNITAFTPNVEQAINFLRRM